MKVLKRYLVYIAILASVFFINLLFFTHKPPEVQLAFLSPGLIILAYSVFSDRYFAKTRMRVARGR